MGDKDSCWLLVFLACRFMKICTRRKRKSKTREEKEEEEEEEEEEREE
jgi:beta-lactamase regulating signal transducer with metallopeptidase domain